CVFLNEYYPPLPSAARCAQLGSAIADALRDRGERIAIYASGGLSHFPGMYNAGWIDQPLDHWILERLERNDLEALQHLFTFDSDSMRSGTGEVRAWISAAAAMNRPATRVEYVAAHCTQTGCGFVYWPPAAQRPSEQLPGPPLVNAAPGGGGKIPLQPQYVDHDAGDVLHLRNYTDSATSTAIPEAAARSSSSRLSTGDRRRDDPGPLP